MHCMDVVCRRRKVRHILASEMPNKPTYKELASHILGDNVLRFIRDFLGNLNY